MNHGHISKNRPGINTENITELASREVLNVSCEIIVLSTYKTELTSWYHERVALVCLPASTHAVHYNCLSLIHIC